MKRALAALLFAGLALAWQVAQGPRVRVLYAPGQAELADAVLARAEAALDLLAPYLGEPEGKVTLRLDPGSDFFNGYAAVFPRPAATLFPAFPYYDGAFLNAADPLFTLVLHELVHVRHLTGPKNGLGIVPDGAGRPYPLWLTEGLAAYFESRGSGGRLHDAYTRGLLLALAGDPPPLALAGVGPYPRFPYGDLRYRVGVAFVDFLIRRHGWPVLKKSFDLYQAVPMPFSLFAPDGYAEAWKRAAGSDLEAEWTAFWRKLRRRRPAEPRGVLRPGRSPALFGKTLAYVDQDRLVVGKRVFKNPLFRTIGRLAWLDARILVYDRLEPRPSGAYRRRVFALDLASGRERALAGTAHAYYPAAYAGTLYFVREDQSGSALVAWREGRARVRFRAPAGDHLVGVAAGGAGIAVFLWHQGTVRPYLLEGKGLRPLPGHGRVLLHPAWDGNRLLFASDAEGVYKLYAYDLKAGRLFRVVDAPYGAFAPVPAGERLLYVALTARGFALAEAEPEPVAVSPKPARPLPRPRLGRPFAERRPYDPYASLGPLGWTPLLPLGAALFGEDEAEETGWSLAGAWAPGVFQLDLGVAHVPRFGLAPERYALSAHADPAFFDLLLGYARSGVWGPGRWRFGLTLGAARAGRWFPLAEADLGLAETHAYGRDRAWGEASEGFWLDLAVAHAGRPRARVALRWRGEGGLEAGATAGLDAPGFWLGSGARAAGWLGYRAVFPLDLALGEDGLFYLSHLELRPRLGVVAGSGIGYGLAVGVRACLAWRYALAGCPEIWLGYRPDRGAWLGLGP